MPFSFFCPPFPPIITSYAKITFVQFYVKKVTKVIFVPSKIAHISDRRRPARK